MSGRIREVGGLVAVAVGLATAGNSAALAQQGDLKARLVGGWVLADESLTFPDGRTVKSWGDKPFGYLSFDAGGSFAQILLRSDLPKFQTRTDGTPEQNDAVAKGAIAYFGTYAAKPNENAVAMSIVGSSFATFNGTVSERAIAFASDDQFVMTMRVPNSGVRTDLTWRRAGK